MLRQYAEMKKKFPDAMLLFRCGDFYETYSDDAVRSSRLLGLTLTRKASGNSNFVEMAGFPYHSLDQYLPRLVKAGLRVAICEQLEDPKTAKGLVKRGITELVTPGVSYNDMVLDVKENNFLCGLHYDERCSGIAFLDVSTGEFLVAQGDLDYVDKLLQSFRPSEIVLERRKQRPFQEHFPEKYYTTTFDDWVFSYDFAEETLLKQFGTTSLKGFGVDDLTAGIIAAGAALYYLGETRHDRTQHICRLSRIEEERYVWLDKFTERNLELVHSTNEGARTLLEVMDQTLTPMGARLLRRWMVLPLKDKELIEERLQVVDFLVRNDAFASQLREHVRGIGDLERLIGKVAIARINPRELQQLRRSLSEIEATKQLCATAKNPVIQRICEQLNPCRSIGERIGKMISEEPPAKVDKGNVIAAGVNAELDELRGLSTHSRDYLKQLQQRESERTGIPSLKIGFNNVFGYYLEVTNAHKDKAPGDWVRRQTLTNAERFITPELKEYEEKILGAEERILALEAQLYEQLVSALTEYVQPIQYDAQLIAHLDCLQCFASVALANNYCRPAFVDDGIVDVKEGRHPVIETQLPPGEQYVSNSVHLDGEDQQIMIITGPNMSGKSALLRQTALIVLLAQIGSYCPAQQVTLGVVDKIFTRVGASDNISSGESTFMVEMNETASILNNVSDRSLVLLDEIGRGTSTYDGISIAWAITEYLHNMRQGRPKVMFATHYHELIEMADRYERIRNFHISVKEVGSRVIFLRKLESGGSDRSFGLHVARLAGMPPQVLNRAQHMLEVLEGNGEKIEAEVTQDADAPAGSGTGTEGGPASGNAGGSGRAVISDVKNRRNLKKAAEKIMMPPPSAGYQLSFIQLDDPTLLEIRDKLIDIDIDTLTPIEALMKLNEIKKIVKK